MELSPYIQEKLLKGHKLNTVVEAGLVEDFVKTTRVVALIQSVDKIVNGEILLQALFIYKTARVPVHSAIDLNLEQIIPVDVNFRCEIDSSNGALGADVLVNITSGKIRLLFEMPFSQQTNAFVSDVLRAAEGVSKRRGVAPEFSWLKPYLKSVSSSKENLSNIDNVQGSVSAVEAHSGTYQTDGLHNSRKESSLTASYSSNSEREIKKSPDMLVNRHSIAMGVSPTPIAARESHIRHHMALREDSYTDIQDYTVFVGTWNVNGQYPSVGLGEWLASDVDPPDVYAVAFQELDLNKEAFLFNVTSREQEWLNAVLNGVHPKAKYKKVRLVRLVGIMLIVLVQEQHMAYIRNVSVDTVGTGIMNKLGNKGAVSVRLDLHNTSVVFVNAHMAAHVEEFERRNEDHDCILLRTSFNMNISGPPKNIRDHDHIYFFGDMNYRINIGEYDIKALVHKEEFKILLENDQLNQQKKINRIFHNFTEGDISFKPTYKYDLYSDNWDSSEKARQPSWCDRILWHGETISQSVYRSHSTLQISDHKPVSAVFIAGIKVIDTIRYRKIYEEVMKKLDKLENEFLPQVTVDTTEVILDTVRFMQPQTKYLTIANTGQVPVQFAFINKLNEVAYCKPWLSIRPYTSFIMPGEKCDISLEVIVDRRSAFRLNSGTEKLYDILVLHLEGGKDIFITITGDYERSCFGSSIEALVHMNRPFKDIPIAEIIDLESANPKHQLDLPYAVPKELWYLVNHLNSHGLKEEGLFTTSGLHKELMEIRTSLDAGVPGDKLPGSVHSVAEALLLFLEALPEPVISYQFYDKALDATPNFYLCKELIEELPMRHRNVFNYLMFFLKDLLTHSDHNGLDAKTLAHVFGIILLRGEDSMTSSGLKSINGAMERKKQTFVHHFLVNEYQ